MANVFIETPSATVELIRDSKFIESLSNLVVFSYGNKPNQPSVGNTILYGASTVGGGEPQPPPSVSTGSGQIFPTGRQ